MILWVLSWGLGYASAMGPELEKSRELFFKGLYADSWRTQLKYFDEGRELAEKARTAREMDPDAMELWVANAGKAASIRKDLPSLFLIPKLVSTLQALKEAHPEHHEGAADRALAGLYQHAPRLISVGDSGKAVFHANEAVRIGPGYPGNHLVRADVLAEQGDHEGARAAVARARSLLDRFGSDPNIAYWKGEIERLGQ